MEESKGTHFDPYIDELFLKHIDEMEAVIDTGYHKQKESSAEEADK